MLESHGGEGGVDGPPQASIGIAAIGGLQIVLDLVGGGADQAGEDRQAGRVHIGRGRPLLEGGLQGGQLAEKGRQLAHDDVLDVVGVEIRIERQVEVVADAPGQRLRLGERVEQEWARLSPAALVDLSRSSAADAARARAAVWKAAPASASAAASAPRVACADAPSRSTGSPPDWKARIAS